MKKKEEKLAVFWCGLLEPVIYSDIEPEGVHQFLRELASREVLFPDGQVRKPSLSTLKRKLKKYQSGGFTGLFRKVRSDRGKARSVSDEIINRTVELKKEQPKRSHKTINRFLEDQYGVTLARSTLYHHLKLNKATRLKLGITAKSKNN